MTTRRTVLLTLAAVGSACLAAGPAASAAATPDADAGSGLASYKLFANAPGLDIGPLYSGVEGTVPEVSSSLKTGPIGAALSSLAWPGPVAGNAGTTILIAAPQGTPVPPEASMADDPYRAQTSTGGTRTATNDTVPGAHLASSSQPGHVTAEASAAGTSSPVGTTGAISGSTELLLKGARSATVTAVSTVSDLSLAGGVVHVGSVVSHAVATSDAHRATSHGDTTVSGVTIAGVPVTVDEQGVHVMGQGSADPLPQQAVNSAIAASGLVLLVTSPRTTHEAGAASYDAGALVIGFTQQGSTYFVTLGRASASVDARPAAPLLPPVAVVPPVSKPLTPSAAVSSGFAGTAGTPGTPAVPGAGTGATPPTTASAVPPIAAPLENAAAITPTGLSKGVPAALVVLALLVSSGIAAAVRRLPDRVLESEGVVCDLEQP